MTLPTGPARGIDARCHRHGFTLIELILVMGLLVVIAALVLPRMSGFYQGRTLDEEIGRVIALTEYAREKAVSEGVPMTFWVDPDQSLLGVREADGYSDEQDLGRIYQLDPDMKFQIDDSQSLVSTHPSVFFLPDGIIAEGSISNLWIEHQDRERVWIARSTNGLSYEVFQRQRLR